MPDKTWKKRERKGAALLGTTRNPLSGGGRSTGGQDSQHPTIWVESKYRKQHTAIQTWRAAEQARMSAVREGYGCGLVTRTVLLLSQRSTGGDFLLLRLQDFPEIQQLFRYLALTTPVSPPLNDPILYSIGEGSPVWQEEKPADLKRKKSTPSEPTD